MKSLRFILAAALVSLAAACTSAPRNGVPEKIKPTKNLIVMITDGTSSSLLATARWYHRYMSDSLEWKLNLDPWLCGFVQSRLSDAIIPDSAPAMSGYMTGVPSRAGNISIYPEPHPGQDVVPTDPARAYQPATTILEAAQVLKNKAVGVAVTCIFPHATPGATSAHTAVRGRYQDIAYQMASHGLDVIFGGGSRFINDEIREIAADKGVTVAIDDLKAFRAAEGKTWAIFNGDSMDFELDRDPEDEPSLSEMTEKALEILSKDKDGFFLMIEGSKVDYGAHSKDVAAAVTELDIFASDHEVRYFDEFRYFTGVEKLGTAAFRNCSSLRRITIPVSLRVIGDYAFADTGIKRVTLPESMVSLGLAVFNNAPLTRLTSLCVYPPICAVDMSKGVHSA